MRPPLTAVVLAGGAARRMGGAKCALEVGGRTLLQRSLDVAAATADEILLLPGGRRLDDLPSAVRCILDWPDVPGPLAGLGAGLEAARHDWCLLLACDMPFADGALALQLAERAGRAQVDAVVLRSEIGLQPFFALYHRRALGALRQVVASGDASLQGLLASLARCEVPLAELAGDAGHALLNVNTPADLQAARALCAPVLP